MKFTKEFLLDILIDRPIQEKVTGARRGCIAYKRIFKYQGKFYATVYHKGLRNQRNITPYMFDPDEIECDEVRPVEKVVIVYEKVK